MTTVMIDFEIDPCPECRCALTMLNGVITNEVVELGYRDSGARGIRPHRPDCPLAAEAEEEVDPDDRKAPPARPAAP